MKKTQAMMAETRGMALLDYGKYQDAIEKFTEAISLNPKSAVSYYGWGLALSRTGNHEPAIEKFKKAIELNPEYARAYYNLACTQSILDQKQEALANLDRSIKLDIKYKEMAQTNKDFDNIRNDPEFKKLISP